MPRPTRRPVSSPPPEPPQLELFPEAIAVEALDTRRVGGDRTRVTGVWKVLYGTEARAHRVFHDRHGWYCEEHGPGCRAVRAVRADEPLAAQSPAGPAAPTARRARPTGR